MASSRIAILGGGLSGLTAAWLLKQQGIEDLVVLEARNTLGGRILSVPAAVSSPGAMTAQEQIDRFDLGPSWFWPDVQPQLDQLVSELGLKRFAQHEVGDMMVERSPEEAPMRVRGYVNSPPSMRLVGGMRALIDALHQRLEPTRIKTGHLVRHLQATDQHIALTYETHDHPAQTWYAEHVLLAIPPRLAAASLSFSPALPQPLHEQWKDTATWMAPHAKYVALYDSPFWREQRLSGEARSLCGPLGEIHDASMPGGSAALFGFLGVTAHVRSGIPEDVLRAHCRAQLVRLFGPAAVTPKAEFLKDWSQDLFTATPADLSGPAEHANAPAVTASSGPWNERVIGIASEWSPQFPGYLAGAVEAASLGVRRLIARGPI